MIEPEDEYWHVRPLKHDRPNARQSRNDRIPIAEVASSNAIMERLGLRTRYRADGEAYLVDDGAEAA